MSSKEASLPACVAISGRCCVTQYSGHDALQGPNFLISEAGGRPSSHGTSETGQLLLPASKPARRGSLAWFVLLLWKRLLDENTLSDADVAALDEMMWYSGRELSQNIRLPGSLQSLTFGYVFNQSLEDIQLPSSLQRLTFGYAFDQRLRASNYRARFDVWLCVQPEPGGHPTIEQHAPFDIRPHVQPTVGGLPMQLAGPPTTQ